MGSSDVFEAVSHPLRIKILKLLAKRPMRFSELKRELGIKSSGKLEFHLRKMNNLIALNGEGKYTLTKDGYAALQAIDTIRKYGWQRRAFVLNTVAYSIFAAYTSWKVLCEGARLAYVAALALSTLWYAYYSYLSIARRKVLRAY